MPSERDPEDENAQDVAFWLVVLLSLLIIGGVVITFGLFWVHD